jgi:F420-non-reducing hydrogenase iron-sulfur subunit
MNDKRSNPKSSAFCATGVHTAPRPGGTARIQHAQNVRIIRVMCSGRVEPTFVLKALSLGADGVMIAGCHPASATTLSELQGQRRYEMLMHTCGRWASRKSAFA